MDINIETGNYLVAAGPVSWPELVQVWDVAEDGRFTSLVKRGTAAGGGEFSIHQDKNNGLIVQSGSTPRYGVIDSTGLRWEIKARPSGPSPTPFYYGVRMDRASVPTSLRRMYALYHHPTHQEVGFLFEVSEPTGLNTSYTGTSLVQATNTQGCRGMVFADEKNIGSLKTGAGAYVLNFNFPGEGGKRYAVGIGVTGYKPGLTLADGRHICLNVDALTFASLHNLLRPAFDPGPGTLDPTGNATGSIALGVDGLNVLLHMVAMTMSSGTIDTISSPTVFKL
jgi:hypothetical protein